MAGRFNQKASVTNSVTNKAGGTAYKMTPELELVSSLLTSFLQDTYYETGKQRQVSIEKQLLACQPKFAAQAALYARNEFGMRSTSHVAAAYLADRLSGLQWASRFYNKVVYRPDDITEILALYKQHSGKTQTHAMRKGFATALGRFDSYQLAKYRGAGKGVKLVDAVNLTHPQNSEAIAALVADTLRSSGTFESNISKAGQSDEEGAKAKAWADLVSSGKLGYMALLKNLRNIIQEAPEATDEAIKQLTNEKAIRKSLVLPFRYMTAGDEIGKIPGPEAKKVLAGLSRALDISAQNIPKFEGETAVFIDKSGSMQGDAIQKSALFGAMLVKSNNADVILWDDKAETLNLNPADSIPTLAQQILAHCRYMGGTNIAVPFQEATRAYSRILILTDQQSWGHSVSYGWGYQATSAPAEFQKYKTRTKSDAFLFNWDMRGLGSLNFPERNVATLAGWSDRVFTIMGLVERDKQAMVNEIRKIEL
jgi:60 kDa SS-A/Ro ribonucleoprotein